MKIPVDPPQRTDLQIEAKTFRKITTSSDITTFAIATGMKEKHNMRNIEVSSATARSNVAL
jgi:hypothetical protein